MTLSKYTLTIALLFQSLYSFSQDKTRLDSIAAIKGVIQSDNMVATQGVGYAVMPSRHWYSFAYLLSVSTDEELLQMTYDNSPAIRLYSYIALTHKNYFGIKEVKDRLSNDTAILSTFEGCTVGSTTVSNGIWSCTNWYDRELTNSVLKKLTNTEYRHQLFDDIINKKQIRRDFID